MSKFGIVCPISPGHLNPMLSLGRELIRRGHNVILFGALDALSAVQSAGIVFCPLAQDEVPLGTIPKLIEQQSLLQGNDAMKFTIQLLANSASLTFKYLPSALTDSCIDILLIDQVSFEASTVAEHLRIPYITICNALILHQESTIPPFSTAWLYDPNPISSIRNIFTNNLIEFFIKPVKNVIAKQRENWNLPPYVKSSDPNSKILQLSQQPPLFDFPRKRLPSNFYYVGPFVDLEMFSRQPFPYDELNGKPIIYASMGTIQNGLYYVFDLIFEAVSSLSNDYQLVISKGSLSSSYKLPNALTETILVDYAPQLDILSKSVLTITHAGLNTTLHSLMMGVPMVAIPITNDQPGIAARIKWTGSGEFVSLKSLSLPSLKNAINKVLDNPSYQQKANEFKESIGHTGGASKAVDLIELQLISLRGSA
jgi:zeaxanthin glucosyltransferase